MTAILHLDPASKPRNASGKAMPYATLTFLRSGTDEVLETYTADAAGDFGVIVPAFEVYTYRVQLRDRWGVLVYDVPEYKPAFANYVDAQSRRIVGGDIVPATEYEFTSGGNLVQLYGDAGLTKPLPNPLKADASGLLPPIYKATGAYTMEWDGGSVDFPGEAYPPEVALSGIASPLAAGVATTAASITTDSITIVPEGGTSPYAFAWAWHSGGTGISITSAATQSTTFSASGLALPETRTGTARCTITDHFGATATVDVAVTITRTTTPGVLDGSASPSPLSAATGASSITTSSIGITASGGVAPYTYAWTWVSGGAGITIDSPAAVATTLSAASLALPETRTGTIRCTITDSATTTKTVDIAVSITRSDGFTVVATPDLITAPWFGLPVTTGTTTATPTGGVAPFSYSWAFVAGGDGVSIDSPDSDTTAATGNGYAVGSLQCTVTDAASFVAVSNEVSVFIYPDA